MIVHDRGVFIDAHSRDHSLQALFFMRKEKGLFTGAAEHERLREMQEFISCLKNKTIFLSDYISVPFQVKAGLPEQKELLIDGIQRLMDACSEEELAEHRKRAQDYF